jgi:hypothetical protein
MASAADLESFKSLLADRMQPIKEIAKLFSKKMRILKV